MYPTFNKCLTYLLNNFREDNLFKSLIIVKLKIIITNNVQGSETKSAGLEILVAKTSNLLGINFFHINRIPSYVYIMLDVPQILAKVSLRP